MRYLGLALLALVLIALGAGCGSGSTSSGAKPAASGAGTSASGSASSGGAANGAAGASAAGPLYSLAPTKTCLNQKGSKAESITTSAISGSRGNLRVSFGFGAGEIYVAFAKNASEARALENRAVTLTERHEQIDRKTILAGVRLTHNVFYYSSAGPVTVVLNKKITSCLH